jgi:polar amino acid transport system permease protein
MMLDWQFLYKILPVLSKGVNVTIQATLLGSIMAMVLGLIFAVGRRSSNRLISYSIGGFIEFIRRTPLLVQLYFIFFILPDFGILLPAFVAGVVGLGLHYSAYTAEVYRAGIENVPREQWEAATALNLTTYRTWIHVIIPQAVPPMIPALANYFIMMFKETPLLTAISVVELMTAARGVANYYYRYIEPMTLVGIFFLAISIPAAFLTKYLERRFSLIKLN